MTILDELADYARVRTAEAKKKRITGRGEEGSTCIAKRGVSF